MGEQSTVFMRQGAESEGGWGALTPQGQDPRPKDLSAGPTPWRPHHLPVASPCGQAFNGPWGTSDTQTGTSQSLDETVALVVTTRSQCPCGLLVGRLGRAVGGGYQGSVLWSRSRSAHRQKASQRCSGLEGQRRAQSPHVSSQQQPSKESSAVQRPWGREEQGTVRQRGDWAGVGVRGEGAMEGVEVGCAPSRSQSTVPPGGGRQSTHVAELPEILAEIVAREAAST